MRLIDKYRNVLASIENQHGRGVILSSVPIEVTAVKKLLFDQDRHRKYNIYKDYPYCIAPFERVWFEFSILSPDNRSIRAAAAVFTKRVVDHDDVKILIDGGASPEWFVVYTSFFAEWGGKLNSLGSLRNYCSSIGEYLRVGERHTINPVFGEDGSEACTDILHVCLMACSLLNCKNTDLIDEEVPEKVAKKRLKNGKPPRVIFKTLKVNPILAGRHYFAKDVRENDPIMPLHICRGHFKDFRKKGLFGKYKGLYWWDSHVRGISSNGVVVKDYAISSNVN